MMSRDAIRQASCVAATAAMLAANVLANALPLNGKTTGSISEPFGVSFEPAGYAFSVWGLIYLGLIGFTVYQALPARRGDGRLRRVGYWYVLSCLANVTWLVLWHHEAFPWTLLVMVVLLACLALIYVRLRRGVRPEGRAQRWLVEVPMSIYLGWITVACIANAAIVLEWAGWGGWGIPGPVWAVVMMGVGACLATVIGIGHRDAAYPLTIVWGLVGIAVGQAGDGLVVAGAWVASGAVVVGVAAWWILRRRSPGRA